MGNNYRFRFSDMLPNTWFYKLRDMTKNTHTNNPNRKKTANKKLLQSPPPNNNRSSQITKIPLPSPPAAAQRKSYHIQRETEAADVITPPRKSSRIRTRRRNRQTHPPPPRLSAGCSCRATLESVVCDEHGSPDDEPDGTIDFDLRPDLPPIITTTTKKKENLSSANFSSSPGVRLGRTKVASRRMVQGRKSASTRRTESLAVVKTSKDPGRDFRESMVEMIAENNIRAAEDLEELLACYLSLNSDEYHQLIVDVFTQIWFDAHR